LPYPLAQNLLNNYNQNISLTPLCGDVVDPKLLVHETDLEILGEHYEVSVFRDECGRHYAKTSFSDNDIIINDAPSLDEALAKHEHVLPLAISSRKILRRL
jgi:hypothetical protein